MPLVSVCRTAALVVLVRALFPHRVAETVPAIATSFTQLEGTVASDSLKVNAARGDFSPLRDEISVRALRRCGVTASLAKALRLDRLAGISLWVIVRFRAVDASAGPDGHPD